MSVAEAVAAEPRARPDDGCPSGRCLGYFDRRFLTSGYQVLADFGQHDSLRSIALSMLMAQGEAACKRQVQSASRDFTRAHGAPDSAGDGLFTWRGSEEHTSELQSLMRISYAVFCLKKKKKHIYQNQ